MCLRTEQIEPQIATKDITCYKIIRKDMSSLYHNDFKWKLGKMYTSWIEAINDTEDSNKEIYQAFHSYESLDALRLAYYNTAEPCMTVKCTIPKGSTVYKGEHDDIDGYASNQLIINEVINVKTLFPDFNWTEYPYEEGQIIATDEFGDEIKNRKIENIQPSPYYNKVHLIFYNKTRYILAETNMKGLITKIYKCPK